MEVLILKYVFLENNEFNYFGTTGRMTLTNLVVLGIIFEDIYCFNYVTIMLKCKQF